MSGMRPTPIRPAPGQESVWDYPRPPRLEPTPKRIQVVFAGVTIADTVGPWRVLDETSHPTIKTAIVAAVDTITTGSQMPTSRNTADPTFRTPIK